MQIWKAAINPQNRSLQKISIFNCRIFLINQTTLLTYFNSIKFINFIQSINLNHITINVNSIFINLGSAFINKNCCFLITVFTIFDLNMSASKTLPVDCLKVRETMFEFLKRKKHNELENSLKQFSLSAKKNHEMSRNSSALKKDTHSRAKSSSLYDDIVIEDHATMPIVSVKKNKFNHTASSITPRKITFANEQIEEKPQSSRKPLLQMISPIKNINRTANKNTESLSKFNQETQRQKSNPRKSILKSNILRKKNNEQFSKKHINNSINSLKETFQRIFDAGQRAKDKNSELSIALINFVKDLQKNKGKDNFCIDKKLGEVKYILNAIDSALEVFNDPAEANQIIEDFHKSLSQHMNELEACSNHNMKTHYEEQIIRVTSEKQQIIDVITDQNTKLEKQVQKLNKILQKTQEQYQSQLGHQKQRQQNLLSNIQNLKQEIEQNQEISSQKINRLQRQLQQERENSKKLEKQIKDILYKQQNSFLQNETKMAEQSIAREDFLLKQINALRQTFNADIAQLHNLYETKQLQYEQKIQKLTVQLQNQKHQRKCDRQVSDRILAEANINRTDVMKLAKKNEELLKDLYKMNQDLFQHWLALKDVKTLSERLHIFQHFERIYLDLAFNPGLFRA